MTGPIVDFPRAARRLRASAIVLGAAAVVGWVVAGVAGDGVHVADLGGWIGAALLGMFVVELVVVGGSALAGMLRAGDRGERLAGRDVGLLPPQVTGRRLPREDEPMEQAPVEEARVHDA